jgi:formylglycine-generating enzyme required for sulfatase activity
VWGIFVKRINIAVILLIPWILFSRNVEVSNVTLGAINGEYVDISYSLQRTKPAISISQPVWVFVKFRLANESDYTGWKDTDDDDAGNDASDQNIDIRPASVNANLTGDVGIVESDGQKTISWHWGGSGGIGAGTGLLPTDQVKVRIYAIEMALIPGGNVDFRLDPGYTYRTLQGTTTKCGDDYYIMKYQVTTEMYKDFLNAAANRHDDPANIDNVHDYFSQTSYGDRNMLYSIDPLFGIFSMTGTDGSNGVWSIYDGDGNGSDRANRPMNHLTWYNCYDFSAWCGLSLLEEEHYYKVESENGQSINYWGDSAPQQTFCNFGYGPDYGPTNVTLYEDAVDLIDGGPLYGVYEMAGNVWEWTATGADGYTFYADSVQYDPSHGPLNYTTTEANVIKKGGGRWQSTASQVYAAVRYAGATASRYYPSSFRCGYFGGN